MGPRISAEEIHEMTVGFAKHNPHLGVNQFQKDFREQVRRMPTMAETNDFLKEAALVKDIPPASQPAMDSTKIIIIEIMGKCETPPLQITTTALNIAQISDITDRANLLNNILSQIIIFKCYLPAKELETVEKYANDISVPISSTSSPALIRDIFYGNPFPHVYYSDVNFLKRKYGMVLDTYPSGNDSKKETIARLPGSVLKKTGQAELLKKSVETFNKYKDIENKERLEKKEKNQAELLRAAKSLSFPAVQFDCLIKEYNRLLSIGTKE